MIAAGLYEKVSDWESAADCLIEAAEYLSKIGDFRTAAFYGIEFSESRHVPVPERAFQPEFSRAGSGRAPEVE